VDLIDLYDFEDPDAAPLFLKVRGAEQQAAFAA